MPRISVVVGSYRGVEVRAEGTEKALIFAATIGKQRFTGPSWESLTKKMEPAIGFEPRELLMERSNEIVSVRAIGREKNSSGSFRFVLDGDVTNYGYPSFYEPEALEMLKERRRLSKEKDEAARIIQEKIDALNEKLNPLQVRAGD